MSVPASSERFLRQARDCAAGEVTLDLEDRWHLPAGDRLLHDSP